MFKWCDTLNTFTDFNFTTHHFLRIRLLENDLKCSENQYVSRKKHLHTYTHTHSHSARKLKIQDRRNCRFDCAKNTNNYNILMQRK